MIPNYQDRQIESSGISEMASFGISQDDSAHIMNILRDTLYSDKVLAVLREYSANAWDAHRMVGKGDIPIKVIIPTHLEPTLIIKDYGPGLSHDDVFQVYTQYGASTKRASNVAVGQLGIGSKSGFAYSDSFTIVSCNGGKRRTYVAILDASEKGLINLLDEHDCDDDTGITIQIPIKPEDIKEFTDKAEQLFKFFEPRPDINIRLPPEIPLQARLKKGLIYDADRIDGGRWQAVMGCIPYRLNLSQVNITDDKNDKTGVGYWASKLSGILYLDIGEVHVSASREELKYSKTTKQTIIERFSELADEFVSNTLSLIKSDAIPSWDKRLRVQILTKFELPISEDGEELTESYASIQEDPKDFATTFSFLSRDDGHRLLRVYVNHRTRIVLGNDDRKLSGFNLSNSDLMLFKNDAQTSWEVVLAELDEYLKKYKIDGIPIVKLSDQLWNTPYQKPKKPRKAVNPKYLRRSFVLIPSSDGHYHDPYSKYWEPVERIATDEDVFVLIDGFRTDKTCGFNLLHAYRNDTKMAELFGLSMPTIYGYKTSDKKPLAITDCAGIYYQSWKKKFINELKNGKAKPYIEIYEQQCGYKNRWEYGKFRLDMRELGEKLGRDHLIYNHLKKAIKAHTIWSKLSTERTTAIRWLVSEQTEKSEAELALKNILDRYPLLPISIEGIESLWGKRSIQWIEYVQLIDRITPMGLMTFTPTSDEEREDND